MSTVTLAGSAGLVQEVRMFVQNHMTPRPRTAAPDLTVSEAARAMQEANVHQLPVVARNNLLLGIVTDRDIRSAIGYDHQAGTGLRVEEIMTTDPLTVTQDATLEEAVMLLCTHRFGALPVVHGEQLIGIISRHDILVAFRDLLGLNSVGSRIEIAIPGGAADIAHVMQALGEDDDLVSVVAARLRTDGSEPVLYLRTGNPEALVTEKKLRNHGAILLAPEKPQAPPPD